MMINKRFTQKCKLLMLGARGILSSMYHKKLQILCRSTWVQNYSAGEMEKGRTARLGASSPWRFERPSSACAQGNGTAWRDREASGRTGDGEAGLAGELGAWPATPASSRRLHGVRGKEQRRERDGVRVKP